MTTKKKEYEKPSMKVFELRQKPALLVGSSGDAGLKNYPWQTNPEE